LGDVAVVDGVEAIADTVVQRPERDTRGTNLRASSSNWQEWQASFQVVGHPDRGSSTTKLTPAKETANRPVLVRTGCGAIAVLSDHPARHRSGTRTTRKPSGSVTVVPCSAQYGF